MYTKKEYHQQRRFLQKQEYLQSYLELLQYPSISDIILKHLEIVRDGRSYRFRFQYKLLSEGIKRRAIPRFLIKENRAVFYANRRCKYPLERFKEYIQAGYTDTLVIEYLKEKLENRMARKIQEAWWFYVAKKDWDTHL